MKRAVAGLLAVASLTSAHASNYTGQVLMIQIQASHDVANTVRIGAQISGTTSCGNNVWYSAEFLDGSTLGKAWIATLLAAQARGANVTIGGTGTCDAYAIETISYINALP